MNRKWLGGLLGLVTAAGICLIGCASGPAVTFETIAPDSTPTNFEGLWIHESSESQNARISFSGNSFLYQEDTGKVNGRFTYTGSRINFFTDDGKKWSAAYTLGNGGLNLKQGTGSRFYGPFIGIDPNQDVQLAGSWKHPNPQAQEATYEFTGTGFVYSRNDGTSVSGEFSFSGNKLALTVSGQIVREYMCYIRNNGSSILLMGISGDENTYYQGPFDKQ
jgi:hypothetical protein